MSDDLKVITNNVPQDIVDACELTEKERKDFDYLDWDAIKEGNDSALFFRFKGQAYNLGEFMTTKGTPELVKWDYYCCDTFFSGVVIRYCSDFEQVIVGMFYR